MFNTTKAETIAGLGFRCFSADEGLYIRVFIWPTDVLKHMIPHDRAQSKGAPHSTAIGREVAHIGGKRLRMQIAILTVEKF